MATVGDYGITVFQMPRPCVAMCSWLATTRGSAVVVGRVAAVVRQRRGEVGVLADGLAAVVRGDQLVPAVAAERLRHLAVGVQVLGDGRGCAQ